jgi:hypothetical protein
MNTTAVYSAFLTLSCFRCWQIGHNLALQVRQRLIPPLFIACAFLILTCFLCWQHSSEGSPSGYGDQSGKFVMVKV